ncbi:hypothetical protein J4449_03060 [Candidatus Woesearchaeota archaeon]|nr:hypothetical protein [Candidatus Woesearchaeota archaeon]
MKKRGVKKSFSVSKVPKLNPYSLKKVNSQNNLQKSLPQSQINLQVAKWTFVLVMVAIFFALFYQNPSVNTYSVADTSSVNPGLNFVIFIGLLALVFFLTYEKRKSKK